MFGQHEEYPSNHSHNLTVPQFFLVSHPTEPIVAKDIPCMIEESNGRRIYVGSFDDKHETSAHSCEL
ncbi:hypothetical protein M378DRAFT_170326 [Amanita muscaria Koide BX008]|uniref:Uncharacterized protein n=1 Tax=Amanita muscaria (strain Koide BX008) TaxID=946122 RepID=A0A0C2S7D2_AMAMK|nr:hypothetical protein M378DRAFT_170326 [Amanita muscaria Koide BX008]